MRDTPAKGIGCHESFLLCQAFLGYRHSLVPVRPNSALSWAAKHSGEGSSNLSYNPRAPIPSRLQTLLVASLQMTVSAATSFNEWLGRGTPGYPLACLYTVHLLVRAAPAGAQLPPPSASPELPINFTAKREAFAKQSTQLLTLQKDRLWFLVPAELMCKEE